MNILEALDAALPEIPAKSARRGNLKLDPRVISKAHVEQGAPTVLAKMPGADSFVRLTPEQWMLLELFDGERSYAEIAALSLNRTGVAYAEEDVREFASFLLAETDLFYRSPLEKNVTLKQKLGANRRKRFGLSDLTDITLHRWPHADDYLTRIEPHVQFIYSTWFPLLTIVCFGVMIWMWAGKFDEIWYDSFQFYNFTDKSAWDLLEFWILFGAMAFFHESAHGMTCKHFGASVEKMEFLLMYFAPTFVCDVTQIWVLGDRKARLCTIIAGIWVDLIICFIATVIWWTTAPGMTTHDIAYKVIMVSGIGVTLVNLNPLIKLDGYYMFSELIGEADLKERSTIYVSDWLKRNVLSLPVELEYVPRSRRVLYSAYALLSGVYSYSLIFLVILFCYHVARSYTPEFAWIVALLVGFFIFRARIRKLVRFMKDIYLDKKDRVRAWLTPARTVLISAIVLVVLFAPVWPDFVDARFVLEPGEHAVIRAEVAGVVDEVFVTENQSVSAGEPLARLQNLELQSDAGEADSKFRQATARATRASLNYADFGRAEHERQESDAHNRASASQLTHLQIASPISGVVVTARVKDLIGNYLEAGSPMLEVADTRTMKARIFIPEFSIRDVRLGSRVRLQLQSRFLPISGVLGSLAPLSSQIDPSLTEKAQLSGIVPPPFFTGVVNLNNDGTLRPGMTGTAKIFVRRRSPAEMMARFARDLIQRRVW